MDVLILLVFLSTALALAGVGLFVWSVRERTFDQADRLALLPLRDDAGTAPRPPRRAALALTKPPAGDASTQEPESTANSDA